MTMQPAPTDGAGDAPDDIPVLECDSHLSFEELAEEMLIGVRELLQRCRDGCGAGGGLFEERMQRAEETLETAIELAQEEQSVKQFRKSTPDDYPHLDGDGEPVVTDGGVS